MSYGTLNVGAMTPGSGATLTISETVNFTGDLIPSSALSNRNRLINGDFQVAQRATSFVASANNDDTYNLDRWYLLSDGNDIVDVTQSSTAPTNQLTSIGLDVETANKKFGIAQIIESNNCVGLIGNNVTFSFKAKVSDTSKLDNVKAAIISWSSTADAVTSDLVSAWAVEGTNPTLASNLTYENTPADLNLTTSWATYSVSANIDTSSTTNVVVLIWSDVTDTTAGHFLHITDCQIEQGSTATPFERISYGDELSKCMRYYEVLVDGADASAQLFANGIGFGSDQINFHLSYKVQKRIQASAIEVASGTNWYLALTANTTHDYNNIGATVSQQSKNGIVAYLTNIAGVSEQTAWTMKTNDAGAKIAVTAEL